MKPQCRCTSSAGTRKINFRTRQRAVTVALQRGWDPHTYRCPTTSGWHLTKGNR